MAEPSKSGELPGQVAFAYLDFDLCEPIRDGLAFIDPLMPACDEIVVDDYGFFSEGGAGHPRLPDQARCSILYLNRSRQEHHVSREDPRLSTPSGAKTRFDQVVERLQQTDIQFLDSREDLFEAKEQGVPIYFGGDTHWTKQGAFVAHRALMEEVRTRFTSLVPVTLDDFKVGPPQSMVADLAQARA